MPAADLEKCTWGGTRFWQGNQVDPIKVSNLFFKGDLTKMAAPPPYPL